MSDHAHVSFCMIVRNGAATLSACLESVVALCDELIVVDTGSDDDSPGIARSFGATVVECPWPGDFSAARNVYLRHARYPWILSLDADEVLGDTSRVEFLRALERHPSTAFVFRIRNYFLESDFPRQVLPSRVSREAPAGIGCMISKTVRLFPRVRGMRYCYPVHESLLPAVERKRVRLMRCAIPIHHMGGLLRRGDSRSKVALYETLGRKKISEFPDCFLGYVELGQLYLAQAQLDSAERMFTQGVRRHPGCAEAHCFLALTLLEQGRHSDCGRVLRVALRRFPRHPDVLHVLGTLERRISAGPLNSGRISENAPTVPAC